MVKKSLEEKFKIAMDEEFKRLFDGTTVNSYVKEQFEEVKKKMIFA